MLRNVRDEATNPDSALFKADEMMAVNFKNTTDGCREVLEGFNALLDKYQRLATDRPEISRSKKVWHRCRQGSIESSIDSMDLKI